MIELCLDKINQSLITMLNIIVQSLTHLKFFEQIVELMNVTPKESICCRCSVARE